MFLVAFRQKCLLCPASSVAQSSLRVHDAERKRSDLAVQSTSRCMASRQFELCDEFFGSEILRNPGGEREGGCT